MKPFYQLDTDEKRRALLARARNVALRAVQRYELEWKSIHFNQLSDTITYIIECEENQRYLLRIHGDMMSKVEVESEVKFVNALSDIVDFSIPRGVAYHEGNYVLEVETEQGFSKPSVTLMQWVEGKSVGGALTENQVWNMGKMMADLHTASARYQPPDGFKRPNWGVESFTRELAKLRQYYDRFLTDEAWKTYYVAASDKIVNHIAGMPNDKVNYGLIHADLHRDNLVFVEEKPHPIDFGRCGFGYHLYDIAGTIVGLEPRWRKTFIMGYESARKLPPDYTKALESFFVMSMIENYCTHASDPRETHELIDQQPYAQAILRNYLEGSAFLFNHIPLVDL
jgi:Ser/Thr protein kinase RdoA (MazF antagonist)